MRGNFLELVKEQIGGGEPATLAVHCVAGLGRAPAMVALALIEFGGMDGLDAVDSIRKQRRGAINAKQLSYIQQYKPASKGCCVLQ